MAYKILKNWLRGLITDNDSLDMPEDSLSRCVNVILKPGMLEVRPKAKKVITSGLTDIEEFAEFSIFTGSGSSRFILLRDGNDVEKYVLSGSPVSYNAASLGEDGYGVAAAIFTQSGVRPKFYVINNNMRICRAGDNDSVSDNFDTLWYGYISRSYFNSNYSLADWYLCTAALVPLQGSPTTANKLAGFTSAGTGNLSGRYFIRATFEYDGYQESWHKDHDFINGAFENAHNPSSTEYLQIYINEAASGTLNQATLWSVINKRITAINIYMAWSDETAADVQPRTPFYKVARLGLDDSTWAMDYTLDSGVDTAEEINGSDDPVTFACDSDDAFAVGDKILIDAEYLIVTAVSAANVTASRGVAGVHVTNSDIYIGRPEIELRVKLTGDAGSSDFPANHESYNTDDIRYSFEEEYHLTQNTLPNISEGFDVKSYSHGTWINGRHFIFRPNIEKTRIRKYLGSFPVAKEIELPYDTRQTVLFSKLNSPDAFDFMIDFVDLSTEEGDPVMGGAEIAGDLVVLKQHNMFVISLNDTGNSLQWGISQHAQKVGCISTNSIAKGNGVLFFPGYDNIFAYDGRGATPITHNKVREAYVTELASISDYETMWGIFDPHRNRYLLYMPGTSGYIWIYDQTTQAWSQYIYEDSGNDFKIKNLGTGAGLELFAAELSGADLMQLETSGGGESAQTKTFQTQWLPLEGNPYEEKRTFFIRLDMDLAGGTYGLQLYKDGDSSTVVWSASSQTANAKRAIHYHEVSEVGRLFRLRIDVTTHDLKFYGVEFNHMQEGDEQ